MNRFALRALITAVAFSSAACAPRFMMPAPERDWASTLERAKVLALDGKVLGADSLLAGYAVAYPGTRGAMESNYWRSLLLVQAGASPTPGPAMLLATYLKDGQIEHRIEAEALYRSSATLDSLMRAASTLATKVSASNGEVASANTRAADAKADAKAVSADAKDQDAEIRRLKEELAKSKEELERIKKRLAEPPKKPPHD